MARPPSPWLAGAPLRVALCALLGVGAVGCANPVTSRAEATRARKERDLALQGLDAERERAAALERDVQRLRADLGQAESVLVAMESGLKGTHTRAAGVSALAEARILVERAARASPRRPEEIAEARAKLVEADVQLRDGHVGSAVFFSSRARRIGESLLRDAERARRAHEPGSRVGAVRANLRSGPSTGEAVVAVLDPSTPVAPVRREGEWVEVVTPGGETGWVHESLLH